MQVDMLNVDTVFKQPHNSTAQIEKKKGENLPNCYCLVQQLFCIKF